MTTPLALLFFVTAVLYASVGFGGGSTYNALLVLYDVDYSILPSLALTCNIIVVSGGVLRFGRAGLLSMRAVAPFVAASMPAAFLGGLLPISELHFIGLLGLVLFLSGAQLALASDDGEMIRSRSASSTSTALLVGAVIGAIAGVTGIGGGIFLAPVLYRLNWGDPRRIAAACSLFILVNSVAGLLGQMTKLQQSSAMEALTSYWPLPLAVLIGGQIGSWAAHVALPQKMIRRLTAMLMLFVAARLIWRFSMTIAGGA